MQIFQEDKSESAMRRLSDGLPTKSEKIRVLGRAGYSRTQIAAFLDIRYQHVRNVLVDADKTARSRLAAGYPLPADLETKSQKPARFAVRIEVGPNGEVLIPKHILIAAGAEPGKPLLVRFDEDEIKLMTPEATTRKVQATVREFIPEGVSLVDDLLKERKREAEHEQRNA